MVIKKAPDREQTTTKSLKDAFDKGLLTNLYLLQIYYILLFKNVKDCCKIKNAPYRETLNNP
jgi:hypothetical protein